MAGCDSGGKVYAGEFSDELTRSVTISSVDELVSAWLRWFKYEDFEGSPYPSGEAPEEAIRRWYLERLALEVTGPNTYEWTCPGCEARLVVKCDFLHTREPYDFQFWEFCPRCNAEAEEPERKQP